MDPRREHVRLVTRRWFLNAGGSGLGLAALWTLLGDEGWAAGQAAGQAGSAATPGLPGFPHFAPKAKRVIYLFMPGAPSHIDLFDYKPKLKELAGTDLPDSVRGSQRLTGFTRSQNSLPIIPSAFKFAQHGQSGAWLSELLPHLGRVADELCFIKSMNTDQINHDPAVTYLLTGFQLAGRPSMGAWVSYALGSENRNLPALVAMVTIGQGNGVPAFDRMWGNGFLPAKYQGVKFGSGADPVLYLSDPDGFGQADRRRFLDDLASLNKITLQQAGDPEISARIEQYEMAARMQTAVPELMDLSKEPESTFELYGPEARKPGAFARNCLLARRMAERGVRFIQVTHLGWDHHANLPTQIAGQAKDVDQGAAALIQDLKQRGMLEDTLVLFGGEFGRTVYGQFANTGAREETSSTNYGRDHHTRCYTVWMAGGGIKPGITYGETDDFSYNIVRDPVSIHDWQATILNRLGIDHTRLTYRHMGRDFRLTDVDGQVVKGILA